ncbi:HesA/MoeB/ThiF family protein [Maribacter confluentis]|uniref:HesA/MoeB/ThiF family protein n=1 Tax=Maribacter confluentis TaxID=1656093 RepID=A0ABT8RTH2_9FLAO|nr:HesA/MoeB/ThiF family protein [Maribacter confluentis]MDO1514220.1 HesA/MoeB/ThiF family protein [Maribacter confluentis]
MNDNRYLRQTTLKGFGNEGQQKLSSAKVLVVGAGGLGVPVLTYLNAMGVGTLGIVDNDVVSLSNLHRQVLYTEKMVGQPKVLAAKNQLLAQNTNTEIIVHQTFLTVLNALQIIGDYDVVIDATDNFPTRYLINDACVILNKPFVYGALHGFEGQVSVFNYGDGPTYRCLFPEMPGADAVPNCNDYGVLGIVPGIIGNLQALETVKIITGIGEVLSGVLLLFDGLSQRFQRMNLSLNPKNKSLIQLEKSYEFECEIPIASIEAKNFQQIYTPGGTELVDVRTIKEFSRQYIAGAKHIPLSELKERANEIDLRTPVYIICQSGVRSKKAIALLRELFPSNEFVNVLGGMNHIDVYALTH